MHREGIFEKHRLDSITLTSAAIGGLQQAEGHVGPVPQGYAWYVENFDWLVRGNSHNAQVVAAVTPDDTTLGGTAGFAVWDGMGMVVAPAAAAIGGSSVPAAAFYMGPGHSFHVLAFGGSLAAGDVIVPTLQIAVHQLDPAFIMSPEDAQQVKERHERMAGAGATGLNMDAVGASAV